MTPWWKDPETWVWVMLFIAFAVAIAVYIDVALHINEALTRHFTTPKEAS